MTLSTTPRPTRGGGAHAVGKGAAPAPAVRRRRLWLLEFYRSALGKKYVMALTGVVLMGYVLVHMVGNLKLYLGPSSLDAYGEWLREVGEPVLPRTVLLWIVRTILILAFLLHVHAAYALTMINRRARPTRYRSKRDYVAANYASRTMRWSGVIVGLFVLFHLMDLTWGGANPDFVRGHVYSNVVASFQRWPIAVVYIVANLALAAHLYHGAWSLFQTMGWNNRRFNHWRRYFAVAFAVLVAAGNISFPVAVLTGIVS
jgi:succinate dehydrogenase / fumarate reductase cytochrome b subunit